MARLVCTACGKTTGEGVFCEKCGAELKGNESDPGGCVASAPDTPVGEAVPPPEPPEDEASVAPEPVCADAIDPPFSPFSANETESAAALPSECEDLVLYFNTSRVLMEDASMPFEFRILPKKEGLDHLKVTVSNPQGMKFLGSLRRSLQVGSERRLAVDLHVPAGRRGALTFDIAVEYQREGRICCFECIWQAEVTPREVQAIQNLMIDINQTLTQGHAGDMGGGIDLSGIEKLAYTGNWRAVLSELAKIPPRWKELALEECVGGSGCCVPFDQLGFSANPPQHAKLQKLTLDFGEKRIHLLAGKQIQLGRNRECDIPTRIFDESGRMPREDNLYISKYHCGFVNTGSSITVRDGNLTTGETKEKVWVNGKKLTKSLELRGGTDFQLSFGLPGMMPRILSFRGRVLSSPADRPAWKSPEPAGLFLTRNDSVPESYLIVYDRVPLKQLGSEWDGWYIGRHREGFFIGCSDLCRWLIPGQHEFFGPHMLTVKTHSPWGMS